MRIINNLHCATGGRTRYDLTIEITDRTTDADINVFAMLVCNSATSNKFTRRVEYFNELRQMAEDTGDTQYYSVNRNLRIT